MIELVPRIYKCRTHDRDLTDEVRAKVKADVVTVPAGFGYKSRPGSARDVPFTIVVQCPEGEGHSLTFKGTYRP